jgi:hypothetical protein
MNPISLCIASVVIFSGYTNVYLIAKFGVLRSISISFHELEGKLKYLYTFAMMGTAIPLGIAGDTILMWVSACMLILTAFAADTRKDEATSIVHVIGAYGCIIGGLISIWVDYGMWYMSIGGLAAILALLIPQVRNHTYWLENVAFYFVWAGVLIHNL